MNMKKEAEDRANKELAKVRIPPISAESMLAPYTSYMICKDGNIIEYPNVYYDYGDSYEDTEYLSVEQILIKFDGRLSEKEIQALKDLRKP